MKTRILCLLAALFCLSHAMGQTFGPASTTPPSEAVEDVSKAATQSSTQEAEALARSMTHSAAPVSLWSIIRSGGWVMIPLGLLSVIAVALIIVHFFTLRSSAIATPLFMNTAEALLKKGDLLGLLAISHRHGEAVAQVVQRTLDFATKNPEAEFDMVREVLATEGTRQASALNQQITYLADVGAIAPMVGLFGTVIGMIQSFSVLASDMAASRPMLLAEGVSVALITTAAGLLIGIPTLAFYAYFRGQVQKLIAELEAASMQILAFLALQYQRVDDAPREVRAPVTQETRPSRPVARSGANLRDL